MLKKAYRAVGDGPPEFMGNFDSYKESPSSQAKALFADGAKWGTPGLTNAEGAAVHQAQGTTAAEH
ncbi:hypothetical protein N9L19_01485 [bacterium]|nr:hypothetical protein [bacterium]